MLLKHNFKLFNTNTKKTNKSLKKQPLSLWCTLQVPVMVCITLWASSAVTSAGSLVSVRGAPGMITVPAEKEGGQSEKWHKIEYRDVWVNFIVNLTLVLSARLAVFFGPADFTNCIQTNTHTPHTKMQYVSYKEWQLLWARMSLSLTALKNNRHGTLIVDSLQGVLIQLVATVHLYLLGLQLSLGALQSHFGPGQKWGGQRLKLKTYDVTITRLL